MNAEKHKVYWSTEKEIKFLQGLGKHSLRLRQAYPEMTNLEYRRMLLGKYLKALDYRRINNNMDLVKIRAAVEGMISKFIQR